MHIHEIGDRLTNHEELASTILQHAHELPKESSGDDGMRIIVNVEL